MRLLFLSPCIPKVNGVGWEQRAFQFLQAYSKVASIDLICINFDRVKLELAEHLYLDGICHSFEIFEVDQVIRKSHYLKFIQRIFTSKPLLATVVLDSNFEEKLRGYIKTANFIHASRLEVFAFLPERAWSRTILDLDECHVTTLKRRLKVNMNTKLTHYIQNVIRYLDTFRIASYQKETVYRVARSFVCSEIERNRIARSSHLEIIPNIARSLPDPPTLVDFQQQHLLFVGNLSAPANIDAIFYFINKVWEQVRKKKTDCQLMIAGRNPGNEILALSESNHIKVLANVANLDEVYRVATIALVPLRFGAGTKLKLLEAFGYGVPVISTSIGCEGLDVQDKVHLLIADSSQAFAEACLYLLSSLEARQELAISAWKYVQRNYAAATIQETIKENLIHLASITQDQD